MSPQTAFTKAERARLGHDKKNWLSQKRGNRHDCKMVDVGHTDICDDCSNMWRKERVMDMLQLDLINRSQANGMAT